MCTEIETSFTEKGILFTFLPDSRHFKCGSCGKVLKTRFTAKIHTFSHTKEKPFKCKECSQSFSHRSTLVNHKKIHNKPEFQCPQCLAWFVRKANLKRHLRVVHKTSEEKINRSIPKSKPGPRRKQPSVSRDLKFVKIRDISTPLDPPYRISKPQSQQQRVHLLPPVSFAEDPIVPQALPIPNHFAVLQAQKMRQRPRKRKLPPKPIPQRRIPQQPQQRIYRGDPVKLCALPDTSKQVPLEFHDFKNFIPNFSNTQRDLPPPMILRSNEPFKTHSLPPRIPIMKMDADFAESIKCVQELQLPSPIQLTNPSIILREQNEIVDEDLFIPWCD